MVPITLGTDFAAVLAEVKLNPGHRWEPSGFAVVYPSTIDSSQGDMP